MRISSPVQAALIALLLGYLYKDVPAATPAAIWPYVLFGYGIVATLLPWLLGGFVDGAFDLRVTLLLGVFFALPLCVSARWLDATPYSLISLSCWTLAALWVVHLLVSITVSLRKKTSPEQEKP